MLRINGGISPLLRTSPWPNAQLTTERTSIFCLSYSRVGFLFATENKIDESEVYTAEQLLVIATQRMGTVLFVTSSISVMTYTVVEMC
jgi:hypothetical protein